MPEIQIDPEDFHRAAWELGNFLSTPRDMIAVTAFLAGLEEHERAAIMAAAQKIAQSHYDD